MGLDVLFVPSQQFGVRMNMMWKSAVIWGDPGQILAYTQSSARKAKMLDQTGTINTCRIQVKSSWLCKPMCGQVNQGHSSGYTLKGGKVGSLGELLGQ